MIKLSYKIWLGTLFALLILAGGISCCTIAKRDIHFEKKIQSFVDNSEPGSEIRLINEDNLGGWSVHGFGAWSVDKGVITVRRGLGYLATRCNSFTDFELTLDIRVSEEGNSGIFFRSRHPGWFGRPWPQGYEAQVDNHDPKNPTGSIYNIARTSELRAEDNEWFSMKILAVDTYHEVSVNGAAVASMDNATQTKGIIALQAHDPWSTVEFRNIRLRIPDEDIQP